ncbi:phosphoglycerate mutase family protein [Aeromicrobium marinum DSM 15272]|uniref:Phosphoglycerate mutase family protein n=1 Tax=Aeromicrobium marinum DSM 15272 TaxID=585531 RepID=E2S8F8_9ACTN|nr:histidine phosphatase family protein [Aeromicrobium marinum]EFQ84463.1 phosphoglycerate mutase family protein [Aeromicrobium marinum DSM 15272]
MGAIQLIRHGQASWGAADYDQLSDLGVRQGAWLGASWEASGFAPTWSVAGSMKRHAQTAVAAIDAIDGDLYDVDAGWDEYDHLALTGHLDPATRPQDPREFQAELDGALTGWVAGAAGAGETFDQFSGRVLSAFDDAVGEAGSGRHVAVFTSGGPIALVTSHLLVGDASLFITLNRVVVNASVTTAIVGRGGTRLLAFNEHTHLPRDQVTFR